MHISYTSKPGTRFAAAISLVLGIALSGCGDDTTGTAQATVTAQVHDNASSSAATASLIPLQSSGFSGTLDGDAQVEVSTDGETWVSLGDPRQVTVDLQTTGGATSVHTDASIPAGVYARVRLVLEGAEAQLASGSTVGGTTLASSTTLSIGSSGELVIEKQLDQDVELDADSDLTIAFDVNSEAWVTEENLAASVVAASEIRSATTVTAQSG